MVTPMQIERLRHVRTACENPACKGRGSHLERHHKGCQKMFVRHFAARAGQPRYDAFVARYWSFDPRDIRTLCNVCHEWIHHKYGRIIRKHIRKVGKPVSQWTWKEATILMNDLSDYCDRLLTP